MRTVHASPAGVKNHHAYPGGLLEHVVNLMEVVARIVDRYPAVERRSVDDGSVPARPGKGRRAELRQGICLYRRRAIARPHGVGDQHPRREDREAEQLSGEPMPRRLCCG